MVDDGRVSFDRFRRIRRIRRIHSRRAHTACARRFVLKAWDRTGERAGPTRRGPRWALQSIIHPDSFPSRTRNRVNEEIRPPKTVYLK